MATEFKKSGTYLLPIWVDIQCHGNPKDVLQDFNEKLTEHFEKYCQSVEANGNAIDISWSVNEHIKL